MRHGTKLTIPFLALVTREIAARDGWAAHTTTGMAPLLLAVVAAAVGSGAQLAPDNSMGESSAYETDPEGGS
jgi:hypothetical protein